MAHIILSNQLNGYVSPLYGYVRFWSSPRFSATPTVDASHVPQLAVVHQSLQLHQQASSQARVNNSNRNFQPKHLFTSKLRH